MLVEWQLPSGAKSPVFLVANMYGLKPVPFKESFSAASSVRGSGFSNPRKRAVFKFRALVLVGCLSSGPDFAAASLVRP